MSNLIETNVIQLKSGKKLKIVPLDACKLLIDLSSLAFINTFKNEKSDIMSISFEDQFELSVNDEIIVRIGNIKSSYKIKMIIVSKQQDSVILYSSLPNKTSTFLLPLLNKSKYQLRTESYFVNAYISDCKEFICLLYRYTGTELYKKFEMNMMVDKLCVKHIEYDKYHVMYLFKIPDEFKQDIEHFLEGSYSKFSDTLKKLIQKFYGGTKESIVCQTIYRSETLKKMIEKDLQISLEKDAEFASKPIIENEIYKIK